MDINGIKSHYLSRVKWKLFHINHFWRAMYQKDGTNNIIPCLYIVYIFLSSLSPPFFFLYYRVNYNVLAIKTNFFMTLFIYTFINGLTYCFVFLCFLGLGSSYATLFSMIMVCAAAPPLCLPFVWAAAWLFSVFPPCLAHPGHPFWVDIHPLLLVCPYHWFPCN